MKKTTFILLASALIMASCGENKKKPVYLDTASTEEEVTVEQSQLEMEMPSGAEVSVPYHEENGVKLVNVKVNGVGLEMIFDTGCSEALISIAEAEYLYKKGLLTEDDFLGTTKTQIADGSIVEDMVINLREVVLNDEVSCPNVTATVSSNVNAPLLLGNGILDRFASVNIDTSTKTINFKFK